MLHYLKLSGNITRIRLSHCFVLLIGILHIGYASPDSDSTWKKVFIGYDQGMCVKVFPKKIIGIGAVLVPASSTSLYQYSDENNSDITEDRYYSDTRETKLKGGTFYLEALYRLINSNKFVLTSFLSIGGKYISYYSNSSYISGSYSNTSIYKEIDKSFIGRIGIIPGIKYGPFTVEMRLGVGGEIGRISSPEEMQNSTNGKTRRLFLIYPYDIVKSINVNFAIY